MRFDVRQVDILSNGCPLPGSSSYLQFVRTISLDRLSSYSEYMSLAIMRFKSNQGTDQHQESSALF